MEQWRKDRTRGAWSLAWAFAILFHQLLPPLLRGEGFDEFRFIIFILYFGVISFLFTWLFLFLPAWLVGGILFLFGGFLETAIFGVLPNFWLGGLFYVAMFFIPRWAAIRIWKPAAEAK